MTASDLTVLDLLDVLLRIDSVNPGPDPGGADEAGIAAFVAGWGMSRAFPRPPPLVKPRPPKWHLV